MLKKLFMIISICLLVVISMGCLDTLSRASKTKDLTIQATFILDVPTGYNQYIPQLDPTYYPFDIVWIYIDVKNISFEMREKDGTLDRWACVEHKLELFDSNNIKVLDYSVFYNEGFLPEEFNLDEMYIVDYLIIPGNPEADNYTIIITIIDHLNNTVAVDSLKFELKLGVPPIKKFV